MKHTIEQSPDGLRIQASVAPDKQQALIAELEKCACGQCACPSPQYEKLTGVDVQSAPDGVTVNLNVKPGEALDADDIRECLDHTARQIGE